MPTDAIRSAARESVLLDSSLAENGREAFESLAALIADLSTEWSLSPREAAVLSAAASGKSTKEIAAELRISRKTAEYFWARLYRKMKCRSQLEAVAALLRRALSGRPPIRDRAR